MANTEQNTKQEDSAKPVKAKLKWFNMPKGFGFVNPENRENIDAFLHITALQNAGVRTVGDGAQMLCEIEYGDKGAHVKQVTEIIDPGAVQAPHILNSDNETIEMRGTVKWYKPSEGFGFIVPEDGEKDVFIHKTCLDRHNIDGLQTGQEVLMNFRPVPKGREVVSLRILNGIN